MVAFNNEIASAEKIGLHLSEIGRLQNNAGALMQFMAIIFASCIYAFNALVLPETGRHRMLYAGIIAVDGLLAFSSCAFYVRCLTLSVGWSPEIRHPKTGFHFLSSLPEEQIEDTLYGIVRSFRRGTHCFVLCFLTAFLLICLVAFADLSMIPL
jgi:hypothetical protein